MTQLMISVAGEPVCGAPLRVIQLPDDPSKTIHCTYPPDHPKIVDDRGHAWDHGLVSSPGTLWRNLDD